MTIQNNTEDAGRTVAGSLIVIAGILIQFFYQKRCFLFSLGMTALFYLPSLRDTSQNAGFLYTGDMLGWYLPALAKTHALLHAYHFTAIDFSTFGGSSDFFLSPNFFSYHPLVVAFCLLVRPEAISLQQLGQFFVLLMAFHSFLACYFALKLAIRYFYFEFATAALIAALFAFSMHMLNALGQPPFLLCASVTPWAAVACLKFAEKPGARQLIFACLPILFGILGGYMPLAVACLAMSVVIVAVKLLYLDTGPTLLERKVHALLLTFVPYVCVMLLVAPFIYAVVTFHKTTLSASVGSLFYSAHQYAQPPVNMLSLLSSHFAVPKLESEFTILWGFIFLSVATVFLFGRTTLNQMNAREIKLFKVAAVIYFATVLATFGNYSVVSDLVYYLVPQVGRMHVYQRFLIPAELIFGMLFALMLKSVVQERPTLAIRVVWAVTTLALLAVALILGFDYALSDRVGLNNYILIELFFALLFLSVLLIPGKNLAYCAALILVCLPLLNRMYDYSLPESALAEQKKSKAAILDEATKQKIAAFIKQHSDKKIIKYVDLTPMWLSGTVSALYATHGIETFSKVFPYYVLNDLHLSSYGGFTYYLSARADYMKMMPVVGQEVAVEPNWDYLEKSGADFLIARKSDLESGAVGSWFANIPKKDVFALAHDVVIVPFKARTPRPSFEDTVFDNGYFRISQHNNTAPKNLSNLALRKPARQSNNAGGDAKLAVDGNTNGDFFLGSVTHTLKDSDAWLEIDLGKIEPIDRVVVWNRTDCCSYCLRDYWLFISDTPFKASDTAETLKVRERTWGRQNFIPDPSGTIMTNGVRGRYVRVQLPGGGRAEKDCFLSLAEVEVYRADSVPVPGGTPASASNPAIDLKVEKFETDNARFLHLETHASAPARVEYQFWDNPHLEFYLNNTRMNLAKRGGIRLIDLPAGRNTIDIKYRNRPLTVFWALYTLYALMFLFALIPAKGFALLWRRGRTR